MLERLNVIEKIKKLLNTARCESCTEAEAMSASEKVGELLQVYNLTMDAIFLEAVKYTKKTIQTGKKRSHPIKSCCVSIAKFCDCRYWRSSNGNERTLIFFGMETDTEMAEYLYNTIFRAIQTETQNFKKSPTYQMGQYGVSRKTLSVSFQKGMVNRIAERLIDMTTNRHNSESEATFTPNSEICTDIVLIKKNKLEGEFEKLGIKLVNTPATKCRKHHDSFNRGYDAGNNVSLNRPIGNSQVRGLLCGV